LNVPAFTRVSVTLMTQLVTRRDQRQPKNSMMISRQRSPGILPPPLVIAAPSGPPDGPKALKIDQPTLPMSKGTEGCALSQSNLCFFAQKSD